MLRHTPSPLQLLPTGQSLDTLQPQTLVPKHTGPLALVAQSLASSHPQAPLARQCGPAVFRAQSRQEAPLAPQVPLLVPAMHCPALQQPLLQE